MSWGQSAFLCSSANQITDSTVNRAELVSDVFRSPCSRATERNLGKTILPVGIITPAADITLGKTARGSRRAT